MPVYNHPTELRVMLESIVSNTFQNWELIVVDDGSDDVTKSILLEYTKEDNRICFIERDRAPKGAPTCRNIGLERASGEFVMFVDADDYVKPFCFEQRVRELIQHDECDFIVFRNGVFVGNVFHDFYAKSIHGYPIYKDDVKAFCQRTLPFVVWNNIYRRQSIIDHHITWDTNLLSYQDAQYNLDCLISGMKYYYSACPPDYGYRIGVKGSVSAYFQSHNRHDSNQYATAKFYRIIKGKYGNKYDGALLKGKLIIDNAEAHGRENEVGRWKRKFNRLKRQVSMGTFLIWYRYMERYWIPTHIKRLMAILPFLLLFIPSSSQTISSRDNRYAPSWNDEFNGSELDTMIWSKIPRHHYGRSFNHLSADDRLYFHTDSTLVLYAIHNDTVIPTDTASFLTAGLWTHKKATFSYGKIMVRARIHGAVGAWPAIWTLAEDSNNRDIRSPKYSEIDIMEYVTPDKFVYQTAHNAYTLADKKHWQHPRRQALSDVRADVFNIYSLEILKDVLIFGINDVETFRYPRTSENNNAFFYGIPSHLIINMQVFPPTFWSHGIDPTTFPAWMEIDWVRVYKLKE